MSLIRLEPSVSTEASLTPELQQRLESHLAMYAAAKDMMENERATIEAILNEGEVRKVQTPEFLVYLTKGGTQTRLDKKKLVALGVSEAMIAMASTTKPKKASMTIRKAGEKAEDDGD